MTQKRTPAKKTPAKAKAAVTTHKAISKNAAVGAKAKSSKPTVLQPRPLGDGEVEVSGVWGRVRYNENDPYAEVREIFDHYDRDKNGIIEAREFARILEALGMDMEEHELKVAVLDVDHDGDEKIAWDDFLAWWKSMRG